MTLLAQIIIVVGTFAMLFCVGGLVVQINRLRREVREHKSRADSYRKAAARILSVML